MEGNFKMSETIAITNVKVFDGHRLTDERTVIIDGGIISDATSAEIIIGGQHGTLLPGFIDSHVHLSSLAELEQGTRWGCTTMLDMGEPTMALTDSLRHRKGLADIRGAGNPACAPGGWQIARMGYPVSSAVTGPNDADRFVAERVAEGADYLKVVVEGPGRMGVTTLDVATITALVEAAHRAGLKVIAHITVVSAVRYAAEGGVDIITHAPLDADVDEELVSSLAKQGTMLMPTLTMMQGVAKSVGHMRASNRTVMEYAHARASVSAFHRAGIPILAGTDANTASDSPAQVQHGESIHDELRLLVEAGLTPVEALRSATILPAEFFGLTDRGIIAAGRRADLLLIEGDPTQDIAVTRAIRGVWVAGVKVR